MLFSYAAPRTGHGSMLILCAKIGRARGEGWSRDSTVEEVFQGLDHFE
jgi:hypothetical protein